MGINVNKSLSSKLPNKIEGLERLAYNLWWSWNLEAKALFRIIDSQLWEEVSRNPVELLVKVDSQRLEELKEDKEFINKYHQVINDFNDYLDQDSIRFAEEKNQDENDREVIAYFCAEFGLHESLPIYSGGLGVLAGDYCKTASDFNLPFVGVGLLYHHGYFKQKINKNGWQEESYPKLNFDYLPVTPVKDNEGKDLLINLDLVGRKVWVKIWRVEVGRILIYLLDTDLAINTESDRKLTSQLYYSDQEVRISQEIILGIGGVKALDAMGYSPLLWHMNEGHSAYLGLERIIHLMKVEGLSFNEAVEAVAVNTLFTTHTPVPAGNETFSIDLKEKYFAGYWQKLGLTKKEFMQLGQINSEDEGFCLTILGLYLARFNNGVSKLHGQVASEMWKEVWDGVPSKENPITYVTNGIHTLTWLASEWKEVFNNYLPNNWQERISEKKVWERIRTIPAKDFWQIHYRLKVKLINFINNQLLMKHGKQEDKRLLDKDTLTIGFARRFVTYKRADLIFKDLERLNRIFNNTGREVQIIFAGKAHPADDAGKELIKKIYDIAQTEEFKGKIVFLEDYDMHLARLLIQGVDLWLNNPRRPLEASGTSGQKAAINGGLNFSVLDGWWCEGYNEKNGWVIGSQDEKDYRDSKEQDLIDSISLYETLEEEIIPLYYDFNEEGFSNLWIDYMKESMISNGYQYSTDRMMEEYITQLYTPAIKRGNKFKEDNYCKAKEFSNWKNKLYENWEQVEVIASKQVNGTIDKRRFELKVKLGNLIPKDVTVELYAISNDIERQAIIIPTNLKEELQNNLYLYSIITDVKEEYRYTFRVVPNESKLTNKHELGLIRWE
ncbi:MAG: alpha-glucan phosphorylase [Candidatus Frackibacter sp. T328-2]|nr:MAG: alpha-glucan phosphorylase [Candidatus Frackibacter sp. T328-2]